MSEELHDSPFFGIRVIDFVSSLLYSNGGRRSVNPITDFEKKLLSHSKQVFSLNEELGGELFPFFRRVRIMFHQPWPYGFCFI